jgi:hypothetical protein
MNGRRFFDPSQPQTLQIAVILQYLNALFALIDIVYGPTFFTIIPLAQGAAAFGIANDKKWAYWLGVAAASLQLGIYLLVVVLTHSLGGLSGVLSLAFSVALVALLVHPISRGYQRIWFR